MRKYIVSFALFIFTFVSYSQKTEYFIWKQIKTTECRANGIAPNLQVGSKVVKIDFAYNWQKSVCSEYVYNNTIKIPKLNKGYHIAPDNKHYYFDGKRVYQVLDNACGTMTWDANDFWLMMQKK